MSKRQKSKTRSAKTKRTKKSINRGTLRNFGYSVHMQKPQDALCPAVKHWGFPIVRKKLQFVSNMNKKRNPRLSKRFKSHIKIAEKCPH